ncbi:hypothetical protein CALCODRAFT_485477 [Calocera cornea HHB12733]|uniref:THO complex subunit 2 n=1 Tax=Calocera cornea HHB12733 TaxID=1353952 RepID=A0A165EBR1_9BASI|nr:hypothetical protein CALCODRAFT_485477 [Calocera cornea HHB12733]
MSKRQNPFQPPYSPAIIQPPAPPMPPPAGQPQGYDYNAYWAAWQQQQASHSQQQASMIPHQPGVIAAPPQPAQPNAYANYGYAPAAQAQHVAAQQTQSFGWPGAQGMPPPFSGAPTPGVQHQSIMYPQPAQPFPPPQGMQSPMNPFFVPPNAGIPPRPPPQSQGPHQPLVHTPPHHGPGGGGGPPAKRARFDHPGGGQPQSLGQTNYPPAPFPQAQPMQQQQQQQQQRGPQGNQRFGGGNRGGMGRRDNMPLRGGRPGPGGGRDGGGSSRVSMNPGPPMRRDGPPGPPPQAVPMNQPGRGIPRGPRKADDGSSGFSSNGRRRGDDFRDNRMDRRGGGALRPLARMESLTLGSTSGHVSDGASSVAAENQSLGDFRIVGVLWENVWSWGVRRAGEPEINEMGKVAGTNGATNGDDIEEPEKAIVKTEDTEDATGEEGQVEAELHALLSTPPPAEPAPDTSNPPSSQTQLLTPPPVSLPPAPGAPSRETSRLRIYFHTPISASQAYSRAHNQVRAGTRRKERERAAEDEDGRSGKRLKEEPDAKEKDDDADAAEEVDRVMREIQRDMKEEQERKAKEEAGDESTNGHTVDIPPTNGEATASANGEHESSPVPSSIADADVIDKIVPVPIDTVNGEPTEEDEPPAILPDSQAEPPESQLPDWSSSQMESQMDGLEESQISHLVTPSMSISQQVPNEGEESQTPESQILPEGTEDGEDKDEVKQEVQEVVVKDEEMEGTDVGNDKTTITSLIPSAMTTDSVSQSKSGRIEPEANRISISYASSSRRIVIDSSTIKKVRIFRQEGRIEITVVIERRGEEGDFKGILFEAETSEHNFIQIIPSPTTCVDTTVPPLYNMLRSVDEEPGSILLQVFIDKDRPLSEPKWVKTGDVNDQIGPDREEHSSVPSWRGKIEVIDPDKPKVQTLDTVMDGWAVNSVIAQQKDRERFLQEHMRNQPDNHLEVLLRLVRGERASAATHIHPFSLSGPLAVAMAPNADHAHQQTHVSLAVVALYRIAVDYAKKAGVEEREVSDKAGDIIKSIPSHLVWKALDAQLAAFLAEVRQSFPSSSSEDAATVTAEKSEFADLILDLVWTVDATAEDQITEIAAAIKAEWQAAKDAAKADAMEVDEKEAKPAAAKDDKPPEKSNDPETESIRLASEAHRKALAELVKELVSVKHVVNHALAVERLEQPLLIAAGLVRSGPLFEKKTRQTRTNLFYKQTKFNLLREESEGYSKLIVELVSNHDQPASFTWPRVVSLIGFFDLDPHRVLDLIFDVMESTVVTRWQWFLELLREAGWARRRPEGGKGKEKESTELPREWIAPSMFEGKTLEEILRETETCDPLETSAEVKVMDVPAQLLGFKFSNHIHNQPNTPSAPKKELYLMVAILIREGVVSLPALYPHLYPTEEDMKSIEERHQKALKEQAIVKRTNNALTRAAPLSEEPDRPGGYRPRTTTATTTAAASSAAPTGPRKVEPPNHKMGLLRALLSVGALRPALWILTKHPWMFSQYGALADLYLRMLDHSLQPLYSRISWASQFSQEADALSSPLSSSSPAAKSKMNLTDLAPEPPRTASAIFEFYYSSWKEWVPVCQTSGDIQTLFEPLLRFIGVHVHRNVALMTKLGRLGKEILECEGTDSPAKDFWRYMLTTYLLPALSFQRADQSFSAELWSFLRIYRITDRWQMYAQWREAYTTSQEIRNKHTEISRAVKDILRRVSALPNADRTDRKQYDEAVSRVKQTARDFCKFAHTNPCIAFAALVDQIEGYGRDDNGHFVELLKLLGPMSYDVFLYQIVSELASIGDRTAVKEDGVTPSDWLQGLAGFIGHLGFGVRPGTFEFKALFKVLANNLKSNQLHNLVVLEEFIVKMSGIEAYSNLSDAQVLAMAGGKNLRIEGVSTSVFGVLATKPQAFQKSSQRFIDMLQSADYALPLLVLLAQARQLCCFVAADKDAPKKLADLFDNCQRVLFQFIFFLSTDMTPEVYAAFIPSLKDLCVKFHIEPSVAWHMVRPKLSLAVTTRTHADAAMEKEAQLREKAKAQAIAAKAETSPPPKPVTAQPGTENAVNSDSMDVDVKAEAAAPPPIEGASQPAVLEDSPSKDLVQTNGHGLLNGAASEDTNQTTVCTIWHPELEPLLDEVASVLPEDASQRLGPAFYVSFWQLSLYDIYNLSERYSQEITRMKRLDSEYKSQIKQYGELKDWVKKEFDSVKRYNDMHPHDRPKELPMMPADFPIQTDRQLSIVEKSIPKFSQMSRSLLQESKDQTSWIGLTRRRLQKEKDHWFGHVTTQEERNQALSMILQHCIMPRALISPMDASFCAKFVKHMHSIGTKNFMTLRLYDRIFSEQLTSIIFSCTEMETRNYARMLLEMLVDLHGWFNDKDKYNQEAQGLEKGPDKGPLPGFLKRWPTTGADQVKQSDLLSHEEFQRLVRKFHSILTNTFVKCLESQEYMHARNAILLMVKLLPVFPLYPISSLRPHPPFGATIEERLGSYIAVETRNELKLTATG